MFSIGNYRKRPFVTGSFSSNGLKTEIYEYDRRDAEWIQLDDYPFSSGDRYNMKARYKCICYNTDIFTFNILKKQFCAKKFFTEKAQIYFILTMSLLEYHITLQRRQIPVFT